MPGPPHSGAVGSLPSKPSPKSEALRTALTRLVDARRGALVLGLLVVASAALRGYWTTWIPTPWINGDETIYALLGRSLWHSGRLSILRWS